MIANSDYVENWYGMDVYVKEYTNGEENINYKLMAGNSFIDIMSDKDVDKEEIKYTIKEAMF